MLGCFNEASLRFTPAAGQTVGVGGERLVEHLERHVAVELHVAGRGDLAHATSSEP